MSQLTLYLDAETEYLIKREAREAGKSVSKWVSGILKSKVRSHWPKSLRELCGAWSDFPSAETLRITKGEDAKRETF